MSASNKILQAAAGNAAGEAVYVEDVFSTYLYEGTGATLNIDNGIDLDGEGGLVWIKERTDTGQHHFYDTERGATKRIHSNSTAAEATQSDALTAFNSNGFTLGTNSQVNDSGEDTCSWSFRKQAGFFDVVTYTGNGTAGHTISHNLGSVPGMIIVKMTSGTQQWNVYHRGAHSSTPENYRLLLDSTSDAGASGGSWNNTAPTATEFTLGSGTGTNSSGQTYVAYLFAHDDQSFGDDSDESIIKCGSYSGNGLTTGNEITLGFEPQWLMVKRTDSTGYWAMMDIMRGITDSSNNYLQADSSAAEQATGSAVTPTATGFNILTDTSPLNNSSGTYIYIAIRRPMKTPEAGTDVFAIDQWEGATTLPTAKSGFPVDMAFWKDDDATDDWYWADRLRGRVVLRSSSTAAETSSSAYGFDYQNGYLDVASDDSTRYSWMFKRAKGFFDVVAYTGTGGTGTQSHNLGVTPELMIFKRRPDAVAWLVYSAPTTASKFLELNDTAAAQTDANFLNGAPTSTLINTGSNTNQSTKGYIAYLFATLDGISKVGSYTGNGGSSVQTIDCGFSAGARFILIKDTTSTNDWYVYDSTRGIVAGNDPYLRINKTAAGNSGYDWIDPDNSGFQITTDSTAAYRINVNNNTYIFLAIA